MFIEKQAVQVNDHWMIHEEGEGCMGEKISGKPFWLLVGIIIICSGLMGAALLSSGHDWGDDFASYIMQAESIVRGRPSQFMESNAFTIHQSTINLGPVAYPWGTPVLLAPLVAVFGVNILALKSINLVCYLLFLITLAVGLHSKLSPLSLIALIAILGLDPAILNLLNAVVSDVPFLLFSTLTILLIGHVIVQRRILSVEWLGYVLLGIFLALSFFIRTTGILLLFVAVLSEAVSSLPIFHRSRTPDLGLERKPQDIPPSRKRINGRLLFLRAVPYLVFLGMTAVGYLLLPSGEGGYLQSLGAISLRTIKSNLLYYLGMPQNFFSAIPFFPLVFGATLPFFFTGLVKTIDRYYPMVIYGILTMGLNIFWPATQGLRFLLPIFPFYLFFLLMGMEWFIHAMEGIERKTVFAAAAGCVLLAAFFFSRQSMELALANLRNHREVSSGPFTPASQEMFNYIKTNTAQDSVIVFFKPRAMRLLTGRPSLEWNNPSELPLGQYFCFYRNEDEGHQLSSTDIESLQGTGKIKLIFQNSDFQLFQIFPAGGGREASLGLDWML
jgi:hypothetical protein